MELDLQQINNIDLLELGDIITEQEFRQYFISNGGQEHYKLLAYLGIITAILELIIIIELIR